MEPADEVPISEALAVELRELIARYEQRRAVESSAPDMGDPGAVGTTRDLTGSPKEAPMPVDDTSTPDPARKPISRRLRFEILRRDNYTCRYCGASAPDATLTVDHVIPTALGGDDEATNLVTACKDCNSGKASTSPDEHVVADVSAFATQFAAAMQQAAELERASRLNADDPIGDEFDKLWVYWGIGQGEDRTPLWRNKNWRAIIAGYARSGLTIDDFAYAVDVTMHRTDVGIDDRWKYFCGVCRTIISKRQEIAQTIMDGNT